MASDDGYNNDELISNNNNIIDGIQNHESRITRVESHQIQLHGHMEKITKQLVLGIQQQDIFSDVFACAQFADNLSKHVVTIKNGLMMLLNNRLSPNLVTYKELNSALGKMRNKAFKTGKALMLKNLADVFQYHADFVSFDTGRITALVHLPLYLPQNKLRLYKYLPTPIASIGDKTQILLSAKETYIALNEDGTFYASLTESQIRHKCRIINDIHLCDDIYVLKKTKHKSCILDLFHNDIKAASKSCDFKSVDGKNKEFALTLRRGEIYLYLPKPTTLDIKCPDINGQNQPKVQASGYNILKLEPGCRINTDQMIFIRGRELANEEMQAIRINSSLDLLSLIDDEKDSRQEVEEFLLSETKDNVRFNIADVKNKFHLKRLSHKHKTWKYVFGNSMGTIWLVIVGLIITYMCIKHRKTNRNRTTHHERQDRTMRALLRKERNIEMNPLPEVRSSNTLSTTISTDDCSEDSKVKIRG